MAPTASPKTIKQLNSFLRGEISAVESYEKALTDFDQSHPEAEQALASHRTRVAELQAHIRSVGGDPDDSSGAWGAFATTVQTLANKLGDKEAVSQLEDGEQHGLNDYLRDTEKLDDCCQDFMASRIIPEQQRSTAAMTELKQRL
jgi:hypothetical protein